MKVKRIDAIDTDPASYTAVDSAPRLDLATYRALGLDLSKLEDATSHALIPRLRVAALDYHIATRDGGTADSEKLMALLSADDKAHTEMRKVSERLGRRLGSVTLEHPAIQSYMAEHPDEEVYVGALKLIWPVLVRPIDPETEPDRAERGVEFAPIAVPGTAGTYHPTDVADQLTQARIGVYFDL